MLRLLKGNALFLLRTAESCLEFSNNIYKVSIKIFDKFGKENYH